MQLWMISIGGCEFLGLASTPVLTVIVSCKRRSTKQMGWKQSIWPSFFNHLEHLYKEICCKALFLVIGLMPTQGIWNPCPVLFTKAISQTVTLKGLEKQMECRTEETSVSQQLLQSSFSLSFSRNAGFLQRGDHTMNSDILFPEWNAVWITFPHSRYHRAVWVFYKVLGNVKLASTTHTISLGVILSNKHTGFYIP